MVRQPIDQQQQPVPRAHGRDLMPHPLLNQKKKSKQEINYRGTPTTGPCSLPFPDGPAQARPRPSVRVEG